MLGASGRQRRMVSLGKVTAPKPVNLPSQKKENNGNDPTINLVPKSGGTWGEHAGGAGDIAADGSKGPPRVIPAQPSPAWGGAGLPEERQRALELASREQFPTLGARHAPERERPRSPGHPAGPHGPTWDADERGPYMAPPGTDRFSPYERDGGPPLRGGHYDRDMDRERFSDRGPPPPAYGDRYSGPYDRDSRHPPSGMDRERERYGPPMGYDRGGHHGPPPGRGDFYDDRERERDYYGMPVPPHRRGPPGPYDGPPPPLPPGEHFGEHEGGPHGRRGNGPPYDNERDREREYHAHRRAMPPPAYRGEHERPREGPPPPSRHHHARDAPSHSPRYDDFPSRQAPAAPPALPYQEEGGYYAVVPPPPPPPPPRRDAGREQQAASLERSVSGISTPFSDSSSALSRRATAGSSAAPTLRSVSMQEDRLPVPLGMEANGSRPGSAAAPLGGDLPPSPPPPQQQRPLKSVMAPPAAVSPRAHQPTPTRILKREPPAPSLLQPYQQVSSAAAPGPSLVLPPPPPPPQQRQQPEAPLQPLLSLEQLGGLSLGTSAAPAAPGLPLESSLMHHLAGAPRLQPGLGGQQAPEPALVARSMLPPSMQGLSLQSLLGPPQQQQDAGQNLTAFQQQATSLPPGLFPMPPSSSPPLMTFGAAQQAGPTQILRAPAPAGPPPLQFGDVLLPSVIDGSVEPDAPGSGEGHTPTAGQAGSVTRTITVARRGPGRDAPHHPPGMGRGKADSRGRGGSEGPPPGLTQGRGRGRGAPGAAGVPPPPPPPPPPPGAPPHAAAQADAQGSEGMGGKSAKLRRPRPDRKAAKPAAEAGGEEAGGPTGGPEGAKPVKRRGGRPKDATAPGEGPPAVPPGLGVKRTGKPAPAGSPFAGDAAPGNGSAEVAANGGKKSARGGRGKGKGKPAGGEEGAGVGGEQGGEAVRSDIPQGAEASGGAAGSAGKSRPRGRGGRRKDGAGEDTGAGAAGGRAVGVPLSVPLPMAPTLTA